MEFGILCFYIILKHVPAFIDRLASLVSYAFTSFSNPPLLLPPCLCVWYLMLLHHSQTAYLRAKGENVVWYLMLLHHSQTQIDYDFLATFLWYLMLLHHSQTKQANFH